MLSGNLLRMLPDATSQERCEDILCRPGLRIERIVSQGQATPAGEWLTQPAAEWVMLLSGDAVLRFADEPSPRSLAPGDHVYIAPSRAHRVESTAAHATTIWLAIHIID